MIGEWKIPRSCALLLSSHVRIGVSVTEYGVRVYTVLQNVLLLPCRGHGDREESGVRSQEAKTLIPSVLCVLHVHTPLKLTLSENP